MKGKKNEKDVISVLKRLWDESHRYKFLRIGDLVRDTKRGEVGIIIGFKPDFVCDNESIKCYGLESRIRVNYNASETTDGTLLGETPTAILLTLEPKAGDESSYEFRVRYMSEKYLIRLEPDKGKYNEGLTLIQEHCQNECILECTQECSLYRYK